MSTAIICIFIIIICIIGGISFKKRLTSGCCGSSSQKAVKKQRVADKNPAHYPYRILLKIDGMMCNNCVNHVENSLNALEGVWAKVDLMEGKADVRMKQRIEADQLKKAVAVAGYRVYQVSEEENR